MKNDFCINGIQQVGVGTVDFGKTWAWMADMFGIRVKILEDDTVAERMLPYTGNQAQKRHACIAVNLQGGSGLEIWQYSERKPVPAQEPAILGDLGILMAKIKCKDVRKFYRQVSGKWSKHTDINVTPDNRPTFYIEDLYGNLFQVVEDRSVYLNRCEVVGGVIGATIGVSNMEQSLKFYHDVLGYDTILYDVQGVQADWKGLRGGEQHYRRVLLKWKEERKSAFGDLFGQHTIELIEAQERQPKKLYEGRYWGDPGFIQVCYDVTGMNELGAFCKQQGHPFTVDSCPNGEGFDMGDASGRFTYIEDPDGTLIEFVETSKVPIVKSLGWYIDMQKRDAHKPLPKLMFWVLGLVATKKFDK